MRKRGDATHARRSGVTTAESLLGIRTFSHQQSNFEKGVQKGDGTEALLSKDDTRKMGMVDRNLCLQMLYNGCLKKKNCP